jgi:hypothetical protein
LPSDWPLLAMACWRTPTRTVTAPAAWAQFRFGYLAYLLINLGAFLVVAQVERGFGSDSRSAVPASAAAPPGPAAPAAPASPPGSPAGSQCRLNFPQSLNQKIKIIS